MTTNASDSEIDIEYETAVPTAGGPDAADFAIRRPGHATLECAIYLALDAKQPSKPSADRSPSLKCRR